MLRFLRCYYLHFTRHSELLRAPLIKQGEVKPGQKLPPVFPLVIYNGVQAWDAKMSLRDLIAPVPAELEQYLETSD